MKKKAVVVLSILACLLVAQATLIFALQRSLPNQYYSSQVNSSLPSDISVRFKNGIDITQKHAGAETWTSYQNTDTSVTATFYWLNQQTGETGTIYKTRGGPGAVEVYGDALADYIIYYKVISNHLAGYGGETRTLTNLQPMVP